MNPEMKSTLVFRPHAGLSVGTGHVMRCLSLAQAWLDAGGGAVFAMTSGAEPIVERLLSEGVKIVKMSSEVGSEADSTELSEIVGKAGADWVVVDGYIFDTGYQKRLKDLGHRVLFLDDYGHADHYHADIVLNQNIYANEKIYRNRDAGTRLLLGCEYSLLRREFGSYRDWTRTISAEANKILITLGGADPDNVTLKVLRSLRRLDLTNMQVVLVVGVSNPHFDLLKVESNLIGDKIELKQGVESISDLMAWADVAVTAGGTTTWEIAYMGLPTVTLTLADNQKELAARSSEYGMSIGLGWHTDAGEEDVAEALSSIISDGGQRKVMSRLGKKLVDGKGSERVAALLGREPESEEADGHLILRPAGLSDSELMHRWRNEPEVRAVFFSSEEISFDDHSSWYKKKLASPGTRIWILESAGEPTGMIRYDLDPEESDVAQISFSIAGSSRSKGLGTKILEISAARAFGELRVSRLRGVVITSNPASLHVFIKAGYELVRGETISGKECEVYELKADKH